MHEGGGRWVGSNKLVELKKKKKKNLPANAGDVKDVNSISGSGRSSGGRNGNPLQCSCLDNSLDRVAWWAIVHGIAKSRTCQKQFSTHTCRLFLVFCNYNNFVMNNLMNMYFHIAGEYN